MEGHDSSTAAHELQVQDLRAAMYAAVRDAERTAVPPELLERIRVSPAGKCARAPGRRCPGILWHELIRIAKKVSLDNQAMTCHMFFLCGWGVHNFLATPVFCERQGSIAHPLNLPHRMADGLQGISPSITS